MERLRFAFSALRADAALVTHLPNIFYLTGFSGTAALLLVEGERSTFFTDSRYTFQARDEVSGASIRIAKHGLIRAVGEALRKIRRRGTVAVAYAPSQLSVAQRQHLDSAAAGKLRWVAADQLVERMRAAKDADELLRLRGAGELISRVFDTVLTLIRPGIREIDLAAEIELRIKRGGAAGPSFETIVASGPRAAWAHARPTAKPLKKNELVVLDQGAILRAYCSDMTRTVFLGRPPQRVRQIYRAVLEAQEAAKDAIRPGVEAGKVDRAARQVLKKHGLARYFTHSTGHGLGLEVHEMPRLGRGERTPLEEGMVVTIEPGVYLEGFGGIRIEDDVVVTSDGARGLTTARKELLDL
jgi:Xaa-Pro aminopeptidase